MILARFDTLSSEAVALAKLSRWPFSAGVNTSAAFGLPLHMLQHCQLPSIYVTTKVTAQLRETAAI
jgi:hypothetical protein